MKPKISFAEYSLIQKMSQKELDRWITSIYESAYKDGYEASKNAVTDEMDIDLVSIAIKSTEGVGDKLHSRIMETINNLCFGKEA